MLQTVSNITEKLQVASISQLRDYFNEEPDKLFILFDQYVNNKVWAEEHPLLGLKAFALLDPMMQQTEESLQILKIIFAANVVLKDLEGLIQKVMKDAVNIKNWEFIFKLLEHGVPINIALNNGQTLLHLSCLYELPEIALRLIEFNPDLDTRNDNRETPLHLASGNCMIEVTRKLLEKGADPFVVNSEGRTPIQYACMLRDVNLLNCFKSKFRVFEWEMLIAATYLEIGTEEAASEILQRAALSQSFGAYLDYAIRFPKLIRYLIPRFGKELDFNLERIRMNAKWLTQEQKLACLPLLSPSMIVEVMSQVPENTCQDWLYRMIIVEEISDGDHVRDTVIGGLNEVNGAWLPYIDWNDSDSTSYSNYLMKSLSLMLRKIEIPTFGVIARNKNLSQIIEKCFPVLEYDQMTVVVPHFSKERLVDLCQTFSFSKQIVLLQMATDEQKMHFIKKRPLHSDPSIFKWHHERYEYFCRGIEKIYDIRYVKLREPRELFLEMLVKFEEVSLTLPFVVKQDLHLLGKFKNALLFNTPCLEIKHFVENLLNPLIYKNSSIESQLERIRRYLTQDPLYQGIFEERRREPPPEYLCGIFKVPMEDPVIAHGHSFEREAISMWLDGSDACPICRTKVSLGDFADNLALKEEIAEWKKENGD